MTADSMWPNEPDHDREAADRLTGPDAESRDAKELEATAHLQEEAIEPFPGTTPTDYPVDRQIRVLLSENHPAS